MEEVIYEKPVIKNSHKKRNITILVIAIVILFVLSFIFIQEKDLTETQCIEDFTKWCTECFSINPQLDVWNVGGTKIGKALAKCSSQYLQTNWTSEQDCTGDTLNYCINYIRE
jgi:hypothetical protein